MNWAWRPGRVGVESRRFWGNPPSAALRPPLDLPPDPTDGTQGSVGPPRPPADRPSAGQGGIANAHRDAPTIHAIRRAGPPVGLGRPPRRLLPAVLRPRGTGLPPMAAQPAVVRYGEVCEAPAAGSPALAQSAPSKATPMARAPRPRVVVSEPTGRLAGRSGWRRPDPESIATQIEGNVDDESIRR